MAWGSGRTVNILLAARGLRDFGEGLVAVILPAHLLALGFSVWQVGVLSSAALMGSALMTLGAGVAGARYDRRWLLVAAAVLMVATGLAFASFEGFGALLVVALVGTLNPSAGSASLFVPLEHAVLAGAAEPAQRTSFFSHYSLVGALAGAFGALAAGSPDWLAHLGIGSDVAFRLIFALYAMIGIAAFTLYRHLPPQTPESPEAAATGLGPSRSIVIRLALLFSIDSFAGGFVVQSLMALWLFQRFDMSLTNAGLFFFWSGVLSAFSFPVAVWISRRIGLINTMVWTHIPSSLCLIAAAFAPTLQIALALLLVRAALSQMDVPTRSSYVMAVVTKAERTAAAGFTAVPRSLASALSPAIGGALMGAGWLALPLLICGGLKISYDLLLLRRFRHVRPPEEN
ncbi:MFS transporter [Rhodobacterales bacterium HKCCE3408]|nr:MFS transporter [Rhodobacterales bacterium HKCCE3408]